MKKYKLPKGILYQGDVLEVLQSMKDESCNMVVTSPPYWNLRDYDLPPTIWGGDSKCQHVWKDEEGKISRRESPGVGAKQIMKDVSQGQFCQLCGAWSGCLGLEPTPELYVEHMVQIFREVRRVLRKDGTLWLNLSYSYAGAGGMGSVIDNKASKGMKIIKDYYRQNVKGFKAKDMVPIPWMVTMALQQDGWYLRSDIIWHKTNPLPESVTDRPTKAHEYLFLLTKSAKYFYDADAIREENANPTRPNYVCGARTFGKNKDRNDNDMVDRSKRFTSSGRNKRTVWTIPTKPFQQAHFATFPPALIEPCILAGTSEKGCCVKCGSPWERVKANSLMAKNKDSMTNFYPDMYNTISKTIGWKSGCDCWPSDDFKYIKPCTVLDPFFGSGTTGWVCQEEGRRFIGIELSEKYCKDIIIPRLNRKLQKRII